MSIICKSRLHRATHRLYRATSNNNHRLYSKHSSFSGQTLFNICIFLKLDRSRSWTIGKVVAHNGFFQTVDIYTKANQKFLLHSRTGYIEICRQWQTASTNGVREKYPFLSKIIPVHFDIRINLDTSSSARAFDTRAEQKRARNMCMQYNVLKKR
jgi:hypothetical protein